MIDFFAKKNNKTALLIVSTTGDTGPAAIRAVQGLSCLSIICFYPHGQVSQLQERQVTHTTQEPCALIRVPENPHPPCMRRQSTAKTLKCF